ncbi:MAG TPA: hypothetical protein VK464_26295 [Symbiobacteriaceae bacterium]|nr:hypothetical protein [Symbiobacteriaceae bacterium]
MIQVNVGQDDQAQAVRRTAPLAQDPQQSRRKTGEPCVDQDIASVAWQEVGIDHAESEAERRLVRHAGTSLGK